MDEMKKIEEIFKSRIKKDSVDPNAELRTLGLDSLDLVEIMMEIEDEFHIEFENDEMVGFKTVGDVYKAIENKLAK